MTNVVYDPFNAYNSTTSEFTAPASGYYNIEVQIFMKSYQAQSGANRLGVSKPFTGTFVYNGNASFAFLNQPKNAVIGADYPLAIESSGIIYIEKNQKIIVLTRYITPGNTAASDVYSLATESLGINREDGNKLTIMYYPID